MKVNDLVHGQVCSLDLRRLGGERFPEGLPIGAEVRLAFADADGAVLRVGDEVWPVEGVTEDATDTLLQLSARNLPRLAWLAQASPRRAPAERLLIQVHEIPGSYSWHEGFDVGVDEKALEDIRKRSGSALSMEAGLGWLRERLLLPPLPGEAVHRMVLSGSPEATTGGAMAFRLYGDRISADIARGSDERLRLTRIVEARKPERGERRALYLATGPIRFCDATVAGAFRGIARTQLDALVEQADSYLQLWQQYQQRERENVIGRARAFGWLRYEHRSPLPDGRWTFRVKLKEGELASDVRSRLADLDGLELEAAEQVPAEILGDQSAERGPAPRREKKRPFIADFAGTRDTPLEVLTRPSPDREDLTPPERGVLFISLTGDQIRLDRRERAWQAIRSSTCELPQLGLILEGQPTPRGRRPNYAARSKAADARFGGRPTDAQTRALEVALRTTDIALVQGPPGTGKTRVIAALMARVAEPDVSADPDGLSGCMLLTSYQHDAVENAATATQVLGLPAVKVGSRRGSEDTWDGVEKWRHDTAEAVRAARAMSGSEQPVQAALQQLRALLVSSTGAPGHGDGPERLLDRALALAGPWLPAELSTEAGELRVTLARQASGASLPDADRERARRAVYGLRIDPAAFSDDGPAMAFKALRQLRKLDAPSLTPDDTTTLERAAGVEEGCAAPAELLEALAIVQARLLDLLLPQTSAQAPTAHADVTHLMGRMVDALADRARQGPAGVEEAVQSWLDALENDPRGVRQTIQHYSAVLAATCQQAVGRAMMDAKGGESTVFRTVLIDEAARANPLDLLIPMARASERIVLVGDHRQLPHILDPDIERELESSVSEITRRRLRESLFERLFLELKRREADDGVPRVVTLDRQFRMHPVLGDFVSEQFYAPYGEGFSSGRSSNDFAHEVVLSDGSALAGRVAAWIHLPRSQGAELPGSSKARPVEARRVAREARRFVEANDTFSVGIITFYAAQRDLILDELVREGLAEPDGGGGRRIKDRWRRTSDGRERLRVGTVDAFQGKEFDIVLLSIVRSNSSPAHDELGRRRRYGFLLLENRLCVAMSRQHRLLIAVGDADMARGPEANQSIPALVAFRKLCEGPHGCFLST